jgi:hypothetical protein
MRNIPHKWSKQRVVQQQGRIHGPTFHVRTVMQQDRQRAWECVCLMPTTQPYTCNRVSVTQRSAANRERCPIHPSPFQVHSIHVHAKLQPAG